jgi:solute carrier family 25 phosphate transporter 23/24/25/41
MIMTLALSELWTIFHELDLDGNGHLDGQELDLALRKAGMSNYLSASPVSTNHYQELYYLL